MCHVVLLVGFMFLFFKQKTAYELRISDWSSDVCSSDLHGRSQGLELRRREAGHLVVDRLRRRHAVRIVLSPLLTPDPTWRCRPSSSCNSSPGPASARPC